MNSTRLLPTLALLLITLGACDDEPPFELGQLGVIEIGGERLVIALTRCAADRLWGAEGWVMANISSLIFCE